MRILHTSDWHLGRSLGEHRLLGDQAKFIDWLIEVCVSERIDVVAVAGDIFDRSVPPAEAVSLWRDALVGVGKSGAKVVAIAGNHDSPERVGAYDGLTDSSGVYVRGGYSRASSPISLDFVDGPLDVVAVPYLDPLLAPTDHPTRASADGDEAPIKRSHDAVLAHALNDARSQLRSGRSLVLAHAFVAGGEVSSSERELAVGNAGHTAVSHFDGFGYVALGHLHRAQCVGGRDSVRYCGTPLPYSFGETQQKQVTIVDMAPDGSVTVEALPIPVGRGVRTLRGTFDEIMTNLDPAGVAGAFVRVELTDAAPVLHAARRLRDVFESFAELDYVGSPSAPSGRNLQPSTVRASSPLALASEFWSDMVGEPPDEATTAVLASVLGPGAPVEVEEVPVENIEPAVVEPRQQVLV